MNPPEILELGCGVNPVSWTTWRHDRIKHSTFVDEAWDLEELPWPWDDDVWDQVVAIDVFEHLHLDVPVWLDEVWRILKPDGALTMRLPAWDNHLSYRDPTHYRVFHMQSFNYWHPGSPLYNDFGRYYFAESNRWWNIVLIAEENDDIRWQMKKVGH